MTITITKDSDPSGFALGGIDIRHFKEGEVRTLRPDYEKEMIDAKLAEEGGDEANAVEAKPDYTPSLIENANKTSDAPMAVDTAATAAQAVADGTAQDPSAITHPDAVVNTPNGGRKSVNPIEETKADDAAKADEDKAAQDKAATDKADKK